MPTKGRSFLKRKLRREGRRSDYLRGGVSDGALRGLQPQPDYSSGGGNTSTSSPAFPGHMNTGVAKDGDGTVAPSTQVGDIRHVESPIGPYV